MIDKIPLFVFLFLFLTGMGLMCASSDAIKVDMDQESEMETIRAELQEVKFYMRTLYEHIMQGDTLNLKLDTIYTNVHGDTVWVYSPYPVIFYIPKGK